MLEQMQNIEAKASELRKTIQSQWVVIGGMVLFASGTLAALLIPGSSQPKFCHSDTFS